MEDSHLMINVSDADRGRIAVTRLKNAVLRSNVKAPTTDVLNIAHMVAEKQVAMEAVTCDGTNLDRFSPALRYIVSNISHMTEQDLRVTGGVPLSENEQKRNTKLELFRNSSAFLQQMLQGPALTLQQTAGDRTRLAYRLIRLLAQIKGDIRPGNLLLEKLSTYQHCISKWEMPLPYKPNQGIFRGVRHVIEVLTDMNKAYVTYTYGQSPEEPAMYTWGLSYLPVPIPDQAFPDQAPEMLSKYRYDRYVPENYDPCEDYGLVAQLFVYEQLAEYLDIGKGKPPELAAMSALLHPKVARLAWPSMDELETYEETILFPWIYHQLTLYSYEKVSRDLMESMPVTYMESMHLIEATKGFIKTIARFSKEQERSVMMSRVDRLADDCVADGMISTRLNAMKLRMQATGLTTPGDDIHEDRQMALSSGLKDKIKKHELETKENTDDS